MAAKIMSSFTVVNRLPKTHVSENKIQHVNSYYSLKQSW